MNLITTAPRGTKDILPKEAYKFSLVENAIKKIASSFGYREIRTPVFEHTSLFKRSVGEETDVVQKEMYTFKDKGERLLTLRPEGTACIARAILENGLHNSTLPLKLFYLYSCYRYEKPQAGRYREFNQFGIECFGAKSATADAEIICLANEILNKLNINDVVLNINSIGCPNCREKYFKALSDYLNDKKENLCEDCKTRLKTNPMRVLDCKKINCKKIIENAPIMLDFLCEDCSEHFKNVKQILNNLGIKYNIDGKIVRGLDYYTKTVFEFIYNKNQEPLTICGGGRYDGLTQQLGGPDLPSLGFAFGLERLINVLEENDYFKDKSYEDCKIFIAYADQIAKNKVFSLVKELRANGVYAECDLNDKSLKAQLKYANKINAVYSMVLGEEEIKSNIAKLKNMKTKQTIDINIDEYFFNKFLNIINSGEN